MSVTHGRTEKGQNFRELLVAMGEVLLTPGGAIKRNVLEPACAFKRLPPPLRLSSSARAAFQRTRFLSMSSVNVTFPPRAPSDPLPPPPPPQSACAVGRGRCVRTPGGSRAGEQRLGQGRQAPPAWTKGLKAPRPPASHDPALHVPVGRGPRAPPRPGRGLPAGSARRPRQSAQGGADGWRRSLRLSD